MRRTILTSLIGWMAVVSFAAAQPPDTLWTNTFGESGCDGGWSVQQTRDGGYIIAGETSSYGAGGYDVYLIKTDSSGIEQWSQTLGGSECDYGRSVQQTSDDGYIIAGYTWSYGAGCYDAYLIKTDASGTEQWSQTYGGSDWDFGNSVQQTSDGGYIIAGTTHSYGGRGQVYLIKTNAFGIEQWSQTFGGSWYDWGRSVQQTSDGGYIVAGTTESYGYGCDAYLIKTDASGQEQWSQTFGGECSDFGISVQQTSDGGYIIGGYTLSYGAGGTDVYLIQTDSDGNQQWSQTFGGSSSDYGYSVQQTADGGYIVAGFTESYGAGEADVYLIKSDSSGIEQWSQTFGGSNGDCGNSVQQTSDGGYIIAGNTRSYCVGFSDVWLIRLGPEGAYPDVTVTLVPFTWPIQIPATGGSFEFYAFVANNQGEPLSANLWTDALLPDSSTVGPLMGPAIVTLNVGTTGWYRIQTVPARAPAGVYTYNAYVGDQFGNVWAEDHFEFDKLTVGEGIVINEWTNFGEEFLSSETGIDPLPTEFAILGAHPNPFNPATTIRFDLPAAGWVKLEVFDVAGQIVGAVREPPLHEQWLNPGIHNITFDASGLPSGIYIYRLQAADFSASGKMVLIK